MTSITYQEIIFTCKDFFFIYSKDRFIGKLFPSEFTGPKEGGQGSSHEEKGVAGGGRERMQREKRRADFL